MNKEIWEKNEMWFEFKRWIYDLRYLQGFSRIADLILGYMNNFEKEYIKRKKEYEALKSKIDFKGEKNG